MGQVVRYGYPTSKKNKKARYRIWLFLWLTAWAGVVDWQLTTGTDHLGLRARTGTGAYPYGCGGPEVGWARTGG